MNKVSTSQEIIKQDAHRYIEFSLSELGPDLASLWEQFIQNYSDSEKEDESVTRTFIEQYCLGWNLMWSERDNYLYIFSPEKTSLGIAKINIYSPWEGLASNRERLYLMSAYSNPDRYKNYKNLSDLKKKFFRTEDGQYRLPITVKYSDKNEINLYIFSSDHSDLQLFITGLKLVGKVQLEKSLVNETLHVTVTEPTFSSFTGFNKMWTKYFCSDMYWDFAE